MINNPGDRFTSPSGVTYEAAPSHTPGTCRGCAGAGGFVFPICRELPTGCSDTDIIWIKVEDNA